MVSKINADTSDGLKITSDTSGTLDIQSGGTTKMTVGSTIDLQGNELVLDADADSSIHASSDDQIDFKTSGSDKMAITSTDITAPEGINMKMHGSNSAGTQAGLWLRDLPRVTNDTSTFEHTYINSNNSIIFTKGSSATTSSNTEYFRLDSGGKLYSGSDTPWTLGSGGSLAVSLGQGSFPFTAANPSNVVGIFNRMTTSGTVVEIKYNGNVVGQISTNGSSTTYGTSSDYRLKENVEYTFDATTELKKLKPCKFNFIGTSETIEGFVAHELSEVVPLAVTGTKDATKEEDVFDDEGVKTGKKTVPDYQSVDQSKLVPLLVKTIQELEARITALESE